MLNISMKLDESFFLAEERSGFHVSVQRKKIWAIELDLLNEFFSVCEKYDIEAYAFAGTLLGAIRHKGFIPWDHDADVCMTRVNYEKLEKIAQHAFKAPYFFQTARSDTRFFTSSARLRNSDTTGIIAWNYSSDYNNGIFIDCFVMDAVPQKEFLYKIQRKELFLLQSVIQYYKPNTIDYAENESGRYRLIKKLIKKMTKKHVSYDRILDIYDKVSQRYNGRSSELALTSTAIFSDKYRCMIDDLSGKTMSKFEDIQIPIPQNAEKILTFIYDDYMSLPEIENCGDNMHEALILDPEQGYKNYFSEAVDKQMLWDESTKKLVPVK